MPELVEQMYCSQQIVIPPSFPYILKRYCKAAIKTQPYDVLRWSYEYFKALADNKPPPVKLRLEYPIYNTEGGLTRGCLKVLANQLSSMRELPLPVVKAAWQGFCLDPLELKRIFCLCEVYMRENAVPFLHFIAVAGGLLTKCLTHTMILLCESLTKEPDGGSAAIPVEDFLTMYNFLAVMDASHDVHYLNGVREGAPPEPTVEEKKEEEDLDVKGEDFHNLLSDTNSDDIWKDQEFQRLSLIDDHVGRTARLSDKLNMPLIGNIERSPSVERRRNIERENYLLERADRVRPSDEVEQKLRELSSLKMASVMKMKATDSQPSIHIDEKGDSEAEPENKTLEIIVTSPEGEEVAYTIYGEPEEEEEDNAENIDGVSQTHAGVGVSQTQAGVEVSQTQAGIGVSQTQAGIGVSQTQAGIGVSQTQAGVGETNEQPKAAEEVESEAAKNAKIIEKMRQIRQDRIEYVLQLFKEIQDIVNQFKHANYDLGMIAGRQMSTTSGEFIVQYIQREIMEHVDDQIAVLPDPELQKKKATTAEVAMVKELVDDLFEDTMDLIAPKEETVEEVDLDIPEITLVYAVPGIGGPVDEDIIRVFEDYMLEVSKTQADLAMPRNIRHFLCPPLEPYVEHNYEEANPKPESTTSAN